jgi:hypothetical protein
LRPISAVVPEARVLYWPLYEASGTTSGATTPSGFAVQTGETASTRTEALTLQLGSGTVVWDDGVGYSLQAGGTGYLHRVPGAGAELALFESLFDLSAYEVGQTLLCAFDLTLPAGWSAAQGTASATLFWAGDSDVAGWGLETSSGQLIRPQVRAQGAAASGSATPIDDEFTLADGRRTFIVQMECTAADTFRARLVYSSDSAAPSVTAWLTDQDYSTGGTAAPDLPAGTGLFVGARKVGTGSDRYLRRGATLLPVWFAGFAGTVPDAVVIRAAAEMVVWRGVLPRVLREYREDNAGDYTLDPSGLADTTFSPITLTDMFVNMDGSRDIELHPRINIITEPKAIGSDVITGSALWNEEASVRGLERINDPPGGYKFAQVETSPGTALKPAILLSCSNVDESGRNRCEAAWRNNVNTRMPRGERIWQALRFWHDFDFSDSSDPVKQHVAVSQWYHGADSAGLNPCMTLTLWASRFSFETRHSAVESMVKADQTSTTYSFPGLSEEMRGHWVDLVITGVVHWDAAESPWLELYMNDTLLVRHDGPNCYRGPALFESKPTFEEIRCGVYPGAAMDTVAPRDLYIRRFFVCRNTQGYTLANIRTALQG